MFEKIPIHLVFKSIRKRWSQFESVTSIPLDLFLKIVRFCIVDSNYVQFDGKFFKANNGLTIGGCASPVLADMVMMDILEEAVHELGYDPILLKKYVDDILLFCPKEELENTLTVFNSVNQSVQFTMEVELLIWTWF